MRPSRRVRVHLVDGTYELFRHHFGAPKATDAAGQPVGAVRGVVGSLLALLERTATHMAVATDHVIESFRNDLWPGYKTGDGIDPDLLAQFHPLEDALRAMGVPVWPMTEMEADDGMASGAVLAARDHRVEVVYLCTPDKDLAQCVVGDRIVQWDRRRNELRNEAGVVERFGVRPASIPDYLALVGDSADGFPGLPGWGAKSAAAVLGRYGRLEEIPDDPGQWDVKVRGAERLAATLREGREAAFRFRELATLRDDATLGSGAPLFDDVDELQWRGALPGFQALSAAMGRPALWDRAERLRASRGWASR